MTESNQSEQAQLTKVTPATWFKVVASIAIIWNLMGVAAFITHVNMTAEDIALLTVQEQKLYQDIPFWATAAYAVAVFTGALGSIGLLMQKIWAQNMLILSLTGVIVQNIHSLIMIDTIKVYGLSIIVMPVIVTVVGIALIKVAITARGNEWLTE